MAIETIIDLESDDSIMEVAKPPKIPPPLIVLEEDNLIMNIEVKRPIPTSNSEVVVNQTTIDLNNYKDEFSPYHWTPDMKKFYNMEPKESFVLSKIQQGMVKLQDMWAVSPKDLLQSPVKRVKCLKCKHFGHEAHSCTEKRVVPACYMCGVRGHKTNNCPSSLCFGCGRKASFMMARCKFCAPLNYCRCTRCGSYGHRDVDCSDNWRRFHGTTSSQFVTPSLATVNKPSNDLWCCNCASKGHDMIQCKQLRPGDTKTCPFVSSYDNPFIRYADSREEARQFSGQSKKRRYFEIFDDGNTIHKKAMTTMSLSNRLVEFANGLNNPPQPKKKNKKKKKKVFRNDNPDMQNNRISKGYGWWRKKKRKNQNNRTVEIF